MMDDDTEVRRVVPWAVTAQWTGDTDGQGMGDADGQGMGAPVPE